MNSTLQNKCCSFYDNYILPQFRAEWEQREECAQLLEAFLGEEGITYEEFFDNIQSYSLGYGLQLLSEINDMIPFLDPIMDFDDADM